MRSSDPSADSATQSAPDTVQPTPQDPVVAERQRQAARRDRRRWWMRMFIQPALFLAAGATLFAGLGVAQRMGWISAGGGGHAHSSGGTENVRYICPMMCTPPQAEPGRCPVCAMELVPAASGGGTADSQAIRIDPAARRVANIQTVAVKSAPVTRTIRAVGELNYDEGSLRTISAYVDGRIERLYADYTGVAVRQGDHLALVYSPQLYAAQVELLLANSARQKARQQSAGSAERRLLLDEGLHLYPSARQKVIELGMTPSQIEELEKAGSADSRMHLVAPISGTVIEKLAVEGQYVKTGDPIFRLAELSTVWLMLKLFPEDAALMRFGQKVDARVQSLPERKFTGRVAFVDPHVDPQTRTVGVRVVMANPDGMLRVGDYANATIQVPLSEQRSGRYDPELADKWISPRHPHVVAEQPGRCRVCGTELVPASKFGFVSEPQPDGRALTVPRDAVLMAGRNSVVYVETEPGRFEIRRVELGPSSGDELVILAGVEEGERVATRGNFLIDSQMQLAGNPSLIDPAKAKPGADSDDSQQLLAGLAELSPADRALAERQGTCPVAGFQLGAMGKPQKVDVNGRPVFICCQACREPLLTESAKYLAKIDRAQAPASAPAATDPDVETSLPPIGTMQMVESELSPDASPPAGNGPRAVEPSRVSAPHEEVLR